MKKILTVVCFFLLISGTAGGLEKQPGPLPVKAAMLVDLRTGQVLYRQNETKTIQPASLTKIMTLYLVFEAVESGRIALDDSVVVSARAVQTGGSGMLFQAGAAYDVLDLVKGAAVYSANDAAVALAEHTAGSVAQFVRRMNERVDALGMTQTRFANPHGLAEKNQQTTARDLVLLSRKYLRRFPLAGKIHSLRTVKQNGIVLENRNDLLSDYPGADGLKTGYIAAAGYHLIATAGRGDKKLLAVVLGAQTAKERSEAARKLLDWGFEAVP